MRQRHDDRLWTKSHTFGTRDRSREGSRPVSERDLSGDSPPTSPLRARPRRRCPVLGLGPGDSSSSSLRSSSRGCSVFWLLMKVVLPDKSELELPDGATGLDAARAIGPKLAEQ